jgi:HAMP domain-containing protein
VIGIGATATRLIVGYPPAAFFGAGRQRLLITVIEIITIMTVAAFGVGWAIDRTIIRWISYLRRIAIAHGKGRWSVRALHLENAPTELAELGDAINRMAENIASHSRMLETAVADKASLLRELHHRVKNNFQVIASLLSLHKKGLPRERWEEIRFLEEHVQAMAIAYRTAFATGDASGVPLVQMIGEVLTALRETGCAFPRRRATPESISIGRSRSVFIWLISCRRISMASRPRGRRSGFGFASKTASS